MADDKLDRMLLLMENMTNVVSELKQGQNRLEQKVDKLEQGQSELKQNLATVLEVVNTQKSCENAIIVPLLVW